jgi:osmoprotectant transport system permease protein
LQLVAVSLAAAIVFAVPLGIVAARRPALGQLILGAVGLIQTIPSLALLVFLIPLLGLGGPPAVVALFLYSLLPIVRNTFAGLHDIPVHLRESAEALGLPAAARLRLVELPMAARSILAGIKTSAVINVGTATLGGIIGAGGYGQLIMKGIRLDNLRILLEGAIPAAVLALVVQGVFELAERRLVPRGLRLKAEGTR